MGCYWVFVLYAFAVVTLVDLAHSLHWGDMRSKHSWNAVPEDWEYSGPPPTGTTIDLYVALTPHRENAVIHTLHEVITPGHPKYVFSATPFLSHILTCPAAPVKISCISIHGSSC